MRYIVFSSGGVRGLAHVGMLHALESLRSKASGTGDDEGASLLGFSGCSIGAVVALLCALGYTSRELIDIVLGLDFAKVVTFDRLSNLVLNHGTGLDSGRGLVKLLRGLVARKVGKTSLTFDELWRLSGGKELWIVATNVSYMRPEYYSHETSPAMDVVTAVRRSVSVPLLFTAPRSRSCWYADGALLTSIPYKVFANKHPKDVCVLSVTGKDEASAAVVGRGGFFDYISQLVSLVRHVHRINVQGVHDKTDERSRCYVAGCEQPMFDFFLAQGAKLDLVRAGIMAVLPPGPEAELLLRGICSKRRSRPCTKPSPRCKLLDWQPWHAQRRRVRMPKRYRTQQKLR
jgi:predicted acylesterase/phospholipase RssA